MHLKALQKHRDGVHYHKINCQTETLINRRREKEASEKK